jgi:hypothetical protein
MSCTKGAACELGRHEADWLEAERELLDAPTEGTDE